MSGYCRVASGTGVIITLRYLPSIASEVQVSGGAEDARKAMLKYTFLVILAAIALAPCHADAQGAAETLQAAQRATGRVTVENDSAIGYVRRILPGTGYIHTRAVPVADIEPSIRNAPRARGRGNSLIGGKVATSTNTLWVGSENLSCVVMKMRLPLGLIASSCGTSFSNASLRRVKSVFVSVSIEPRGTPSRNARPECLAQ
jgi:hypothetical protein